MSLGARFEKSQPEDAWEWALEINEAANRAWVRRRELEDEGR